MSCSFRRLRRASRFWCSVVDVIRFRCRLVSGRTPTVHRRLRSLPCRKTAQLVSPDAPTPFASLRRRRPALPAGSAAIGIPAAVISSTSPVVNTADPRPPFASKRRDPCLHPVGHQCLPHVPRPAPVRAAGPQGAALSVGLSGPWPLGRSPLV